MPLGENVIKWGLLEWELLQADSGGVGLLLRGSVCSWALRCNILPDVFLGGTIVWVRWVSAIDQKQVPNRLGYIITQLLH